MRINNILKKTKVLSDRLVGLDSETTDKDFPDSRPTNISILSYSSNTDSNLNLDLNIRNSFGYWTSPMAAIIQNKSYTEINSKNNYDFYDAIKIVNNFIKRHLKNKTIIGHNIKEYDLKQLNIWNNKCLIETYPFRETFGNEILDSMEMAILIQAMDFAKFNKFKYSNVRLETLMKYYISDYVQSHGAATDVKDVFKLIKLIRKDIKHLDTHKYMEWYSMKNVRELYNNGCVIFRPDRSRKFEVLIPITDAKFDSKLQKNWKIFLKYDEDKIDYSDCNPHSISNQMKSNLSAVLRPLKSQLPFPYFNNKKEVTEIGAAMINKEIPFELYYRAIRILKEDKDFIRNLHIKFDQKKERRNYIGNYKDGDGFFDEDKHNMRFFQNATPEKKKEICQFFKNDGIRRNAELLIFNKHPEVLSSKEWKNKFDEICNDFFDDKNTSRVTYSYCIEDFARIKEKVGKGELSLSKKQRDIIDDYKVRLEAFKAHPEKFWEFRHGY